MEGRKLQLAGGSTYLVSLPRRWVTKAGLKAGDTLFVATETDGSISVRPSPGEKPEARRKLFDERNGEAHEHLLRKLIGAYVSGFGLIEIRFPPENGPAMRKVARDFCRLVIGPEVIEEARGSLTIHDLSDPSELSSEKCIRRMHLVVRAMLGDAVLALKSSDASLARDVVQRDQDVDRLYWMVAKRLHMVNGANGRSSDPEDIAVLQAHRLVAKMLERTGDHAVRIANTFPALSEKRQIEPKLMRELEEAASSATAILDKAFGALVSSNLDAANEAIDSRAQHQGLIDALSHRVATRKGEELLALGAVVDSLGRAASYATDIAEQAIDLAVLREPAK
jgi:phosphate uptake regulator